MRYPLDSWTNISTHFGDPVPGSFFGKHLGTDFATPVGTAVFAPIAGTVTRVGTVPDVGYFIEMTGSDGLFYRLLHLNSYAVATGQPVSEGQEIGLSGNTGSVSTGPHLHIDIRHPSAWNESFSNYIDPEVYLKKGGTTVQPPSDAQIEATINYLHWAYYGKAPAAAVADSWRGLLKNSFVDGQQTIFSACDKDPNALKNKGVAGYVPVTEQLYRKD